MQAQQTNNHAYLYSVIRFSPMPVRGESVNVGLMVWDTAGSRMLRIADDLSLVEQVSRGRFKAQRAVEVLSQFLFPDSLQELGERANRDHEIVWFGRPNPMLAGSQEEALERMWRYFVA